MEAARGCRHVSQLITAFRDEDQVVCVMPYHRSTDFRVRVLLFLVFVHACLPRILHRTISKRSRSALSKPTFATFSAPFATSMLGTLCTETSNPPTFSSTPATGPTEQAGAFSATLVSRRYVSHAYTPLPPSHMTPSGFPTSASTAPNARNVSTRPRQKSTHTANAPHSPRTKKKWCAERCRPCEKSPKAEAQTWVTKPTISGDCLCFLFLGGG